MRFEAPGILAKNLADQEILTFVVPVGATDENGMPKLLPDTIKLYRKFRIGWEVDIGAGWKFSGSSDNTMYVTLEQPKPTGSVPTIAFESMLDIGTRNADGLSSAAGALNAIWSDFADASTPVKRKPIDGYNLVDGQAMLFWDDVNPVGRPKMNRLIEQNRQSVFVMLDPSPDLRMPEGSTTAVDLVNRGTCAAWSNLWLYTLRVMGIDGGSPVEVTSDQPQVDPLNQNLLFEGSYIMMIKNWDWDILPIPAFKPGFPWKVGTDVKDALGTSGQGVANPPGAFWNHYVVVLPDGSVLDPSYGNRFASQNAWENGSITGFAKALTRPTASSFAEPDGSAAKKNDESKRETKFLPLFEM